MKKRFYRKCPLCNIELGYTQKRERNKAEKNNNKCFKCGSKSENRSKEKKFFRECSKCKNKIGYTNIKNRNKAENKKTLCGKCGSEKYSKTTEGIKNIEKLSQLNKEKFAGKNNPFYGKHHSLETIKKIVKANKNNPVFKTKKFKRKMSKLTSGKNNGMYERNVYSVWIKKYGREIADEKMKEMKIKCSKRSSGKNNPMYGRPSPVGSGNGWSGWYKNWYFRSLRELSYMIMVIEKNNYKWETAENKKYAIKYKDIEGKDRTYRADFVLDKKIIVEIKPKKLMETPSNILKKESAEKYCKENGFKYRMVDIKIINIDIIINLHENKSLRFVDKYEKRLEKIICKSEKKKK